MKSQKIVSLLPFVAAMFGGLFLLTGCEKDSLNGLPEGAMLITSEKSNGDGKTTVNGLAVNWQEGDVIKLNDGEYTIQLTGEGAPYISGVDNSVAMNAGFPASAVVGPQSSTFTMNIPSSYTYTEAGGVQKLDMPMVAHTAANGTTMTFYHLCSTVNVKVINQLGSIYYIDTIIVTSNSKPLCGSITVEATGPTYVLGRPALSDATKSVKMNFVKNSVSIANSGTKFIQIPVVFNGSASDITVKVIGHGASGLDLHTGKVDASAKITYSNHVSTTLPCAQVLTAPCNIKYGIGAVSATGWAEFSVGASSKVYFSRGNLQYNAYSTTWRFAPTQQTYCGSDNANISSSYDGWIDMFGFGTSGNATGATANQPYAVSTTNSHYYDSDLTGTNADWGSNSISNATGSWRTLTPGEFTYVLFTRNSGTTVNGTANAKFAFARVNSINGLILFPDNTIIPALQNSSWSTINSYCNFIDNSISASDWALLETVGCVFLPASGRRPSSNPSSFVAGNGFYWTARSSDSEQSYRLNFEPTANPGSGPVGKCNGFAVRLVQDI